MKAMQTGHAVVRPKDPELGKPWLISVVYSKAFMPSRGPAVPSIKIGRPFEISILRRAMRHAMVMLLASR
jgi:hypothetical protein